MDGGIVSAVGGGVRPRSMRATIVGLLAVVVLAGSCSVPLLDDSANESTPADDPTGDDGQPADETAEGTDAGGTGTGGVGPLDRRLATCPFDVETVTEVECGVVTLPGGGEDPDFTVEIMFARFAATGEADAVEPDPVVFLHGGPGGRAVEDAPWIYDDVVAPHIASRDVILYDQRGGGRSTPELRCSSADLVSIRARAEAGTATRMVLAMEGALEECARRRFESGEIDPTAYSTIANVRDLVGLLAALDVDEYNIHGLSYGSRLAQAVLRDAPDGVRSVVLSGVYPTDVSPFHHVPATMETALDHIFVGCLADPDCGEALSDPWASFEALVADLDRKPTWVQGAPGRSEITPEVFDGDRFLAAVHGTLYARDGAGSITDLLIDVEAGDRSRLRRLADHSVGRPESLLTSLLVVCADEMAFPADRDDLIRPERQFLAEWVDPVGLLGANTPRYCDALGVDWPADGQDDPVTWEVPTLILAGAADPITPARWARLVADRLPRARLVVNPASTHDADSGWCASAALRDFVERPDRLLDLSCFDPGGELAPNNLAGAFFDPLDSSVVELTVQGVGAVEARLPDWTAFGYGPTQMRWRGLDLFDPTVVAVQGPDETVDIVDLVGLEGDFGRWDPAQSELTPTGWSRAVRSSFRVALVRYTDESSGLALVLVAERGDPDELERRLLAPAARSVAVPA